jgi:ribonuclease PH
MSLLDERARDAMRPVSFDLHFTRWAEGSVLCKFGHTHVLCNVTLEEELPRWLQEREQPHGWLTADYQMLPRSTHRRRTEGLCPGGRVQEISRLIGRSLRMALDLERLGERQLVVDCTVLQADGGTRTAAITGGWVAVALALQPLIAAGTVPAAVMRHQVAAVSAGLVDGQPVLDLDYAADSRADVDLNVVMTAAGSIVEVQGTGERAPLSRSALEQLLDLAAGGIDSLVAQQKSALGEPSAGQMEAG